MKEYLKERTEVAEIMKRLYNRGLTTASGGNISLRLSKDLFCITPSKLDKSCLKPETIALVGIDGKNYTPNLHLSIEAEIHRLLLIKRPDINAVVHSHPVYASTFSAVPGKNPINCELTAETYLFISEIVNVPYKLTGTQDLAELTSEAGKTHNVMLLQNHGVIALAKTLFEAFDRVDLLERAAQMTLIAKQMESFGMNVKSLSEEQMEELRKL